MATFRTGHWTRKSESRNQPIRKRLAKDPHLTQRELSEANARDCAILHLIARHGLRCYLCRTTNTQVKYELEHIIPRSLGGADDAQNLEIACKSCNAQKSDRIVSIRILDRIPCYWMAR